MVKTNKTILRGVLMATYLLIISICVFLISSLFSYLNTGADRSKMLHTKVNKSEQYVPKVIWIEDGNEGRKMDLQTLNQIESHYLEAWYVKHIANKTNLTDGLDDYYTESARKNLFEFISHNKKENIAIESTTLAHNLNIEFFSEDGKLVVLKDKNVVEYKKIIQNNSILLETTEVSNYTIILLLEDGFWRIRHFVKDATTPFDRSIPSTPINTIGMKGINYYPQATPWNMFGDDFDIKIIENDFNIIKNADLNTIRIFIPYENFGKHNVKKEQLNKLKKVLDTAEEQGLEVVVTLFDFYGNYDVFDWILNHKHVATIVSSFKNHKAIIAWDIKNEPNLDFDSRGKQNVISWLEHIAILIKKIDKNHAITIGWSNTESATILKDKVDFISFHYYENKDKFEEEYQTLSKKVFPKIAVLGEFGVSSYSGFWKPFSGSEEKQAAYYKDMQQVFTKNKIPFLSWTLYDFDNIPKEVVGIRPWRVYPQKKFGFISNTGKKKQAFKFISK